MRGDQVKLFASSDGASGFHTNAWTWSIGYGQTNERAKFEAGDARILKLVRSYAFGLLGFWNDIYESVPMYWCSGRNLFLEGIWPGSSLDRLYARRLNLQHFLLLG